MLGTDMTALTSLNIASLTITILLATTETSEFVNEKPIAMFARTPTTLRASKTMTATSITLTIATTVVATTTIKETTTETSFTYSLNETTTASTSDVSVLISNTYTLTSMSTIT
ncbi:hypothetical protein MAM1_0137d06315 [Mucor ambiguus]|uniref:Uncharacterized protein n=1 Tax=Mucor ambiguus TaxID=91626 RepID=A0A0C9LVI3_9FUNG|nr:hypothetical protein MAM1_0137d06315 [Mucor ambiguus]